MKRIHIVGAPRSGTTLMQSLMGACFEIDGVLEKELRLWRAAGHGYRILCSKRPGDEALAPGLLPLDPLLHFVYMLRDPRDTAVSRHARAPDTYWSNLGAFKDSLGAARKVWDHPRFHVVKYEDLAADPDAVQARLAAHMPFLRERALFSEFHQVVSDADVKQRALGGVRPINKASIGAWRQHLPRIKAQLVLHGPITEDLIALGYEPDARWLDLLETVEPENRASLRPETVSPSKAFRRGLRRQMHKGTYLTKRAVGALMDMVLGPKPG